MPTAARKKAHIISSFTDSGTGESFTAGDKPMIDVGTFANYEAAGLVRHAPAPIRSAGSTKRRTAHRAKASTAPATSTSATSTKPAADTTSPAA